MSIKEMEKADSEGPGVRKWLRKNSRSYRLGDAEARKVALAVWSIRGLTRPEAFAEVQVTFIKQNFYVAFNRDIDDDSLRSISRAYGKGLLRASKKKAGES